MMVELSTPTFGRNIRYLRGKYYLTRRSLGKLIGVSTAILGRVEREEPEMALDYEHLKRIQDIFCISMEDLFHTDLTQQETHSIHGSYPTIPMP